MLQQPQIRLWVYLYVMYACRRVFMFACYIFRCFINNPVQALEFQKALLQVSFTPSKTKVDIQYKKLDYELSHELQDDLRKYQEKFKLHRDIAQCPVPPRKIRKNRYQRLLVQSAFPDLLIFVIIFCTRLQNIEMINTVHCEKSVQIRSFFCPHFPVCIFSPNTGKYGPEKTPYLNTFHAGVC